MKKLAIILAMVIVFTAIPFASIPSTAASSGAYVYEVISEADKTCKIVGCNEGYLDRNTTIPAEISGYKVIEIGAHAFQDVENIKTVTISDGIETIGEFAFLSCGGITEVVLPTSVKTIREGAFMECKKLAKINFPDSITFIGRSVVYDTQFIQIEVTQPEEDSGGFEIGMGTITITNKSSWPGGMLYIGKHLIMSDPKKTGKVTIKDGTKTIAGDAFFWCDEITGVTIPDSVVTIGEYAFYQCEKLTSITIPKNVKNIEESAFAQCYALKNVSIPSSVTKIGDWAFSGCNAFTSVTVPGTVNSVGAGAYSYCSGLKTAKISSGVISIGDSVFYGCGALSSVTIPNSVTKVGSNILDLTAYYENGDNWSGNYLYIGNFLIDVKQKATGSCSVKSGTTVIADDAFAAANQITSVTIPSSVKRIEDGMFRKCTALKTINVSADNATFSSDNGCLYNKNKTKLLCIPVASGIKDYTASSTLRELGDFATYGCKTLSTASLSESVVKIGKYNFYDCNELKSVTVNGSKPEIGTFTFDKSEKLTVYGAEKSSVETYCKNNSIPFVKLQVEEIIMGDANGDGQVTALDARVALQVAADIIVPTEAQMKVLDTNGDGQVTALDTRWILQRAAGLV